MSSSYPPTPANSGSVPVTLNPAIKLTKTAKSISIEKQIVEAIIKVIKETNGHLELKMNPHFIEFILTHIYDLVASHPSRSRPLDVRVISSQVFQQVFNPDPQELVAFNNLVDYIILNRSHILSTGKKALSCCSSFFKKA